MRPADDDVHEWTYRQHEIGGPGIEYVLTIAGDIGACPWCGTYLVPHKTPKQWGWLCFVNCGYYRRMRRAELVTVTEHAI